MKNMFITGGSGLVGMYVLDHFLKKKFRVLTTVRSMKSKNYLEKKFKNFVRWSSFNIKTRFQ